MYEYPRVVNFFSASFHMYGIPVLLTSFLLSSTFLNPFATGNPFLGTTLLGFSIGRGLGALKGLRNKCRWSTFRFK